EVERLWSIGAPPRALAGTSSDWIDFSEVPSGFGPESGVLVAGNHLLAGELASDTLLVRDGASRFPIDSARVVRFSRSPEPETSDRFTIVLEGGESVEGSLVGTYLSLAMQNATIEVPMEFVRAFQKSTPSE